MSEHKVRLEELLPIMEECLQNGQSFTFSPRGISMLPMLRQGIDTVTLSPVNGRLKKYDLPLYRRPDGKFVLHRIVKSADTYTCIGDNQFSYEHGVSHDWVIAVVTAFTRGDKKHSVNEIGYKLYCRFWHLTRYPRRYWQALKKHGVFGIIRKLTGYNQKKL